MFGPGGVSPIQLLIVLALVLLFFGGRGKISAMMSDMAKGLRSFRKGMKDDEEPETAERQPLEDGKTINVTPQKDKTKA
ncbi:twin-arginine translocase TatA/TatE family subunit [bacterium]|nr:twin-arginine translocase TatA/TatE family subunit [bacterium]